ncbi:nitrate- and nitrite sensing domain-containing protein [Streptomyces erythrochromogenes]|uniref:sensor histidine kinase n=1 Tax=Streptomyces erythrochromogenes TaxID=285574 RepID=UPI0034349B8D
MSPFRSRRRAQRAEAASSGRVAVLGRLSVPTRMLAVLMIPLIAAVVLAGLRVNDAVGRRDQYDRLHQIAELSRSGTKLIDDLQQERDLLIDPQAQAAAGAGALQNQQERTSSAAKAFLDAARSIPSTSRLDQHFSAIEGALNNLPTLRQQAGNLSAAKVTSAYLRVLMPINGINNELGGDLDQTYAPGWSSYSLTLDTAMTWSERALIANSAKSGTVSTEQRAALMSSARLQEVAQQEFRVNATPADTAAYDKLVSNPAVAPAGGAVKAVVETPDAKLPANALPANWYEAFSTRINDLRQLQGTVGQRLVDSFAQQRDDAQDRAYEDILVAALILMVALALAFSVSRSILNGLHTLESSAVDVAEQRLPAAMKALTSGKGGGAELQVVPVAGGGRDEFAAVGRAVDQLHREAVRLAAGQARLRENVSSIFRNLSHRNQALVQRQLRVITDLERDEPDPQQLARLFQLDHLATRMRRNSENLLVLAGAEPGARTVGPMLLHDAVRSAISEVEQYQRIVVHALPESSLKGEAVRDVVHLLAELMENAVSFSSPHTSVTVDSQRLPDQRQVLEICDRGIGMSTEQLAEANRILMEGPELDVRITEQLGLYVVGTLARRHGITVALRHASPGISTLVILPGELMHTGPAFTDSRQPSGPPAPAPQVPDTGQAGTEPGPVPSAPQVFEPVAPAAPVAHAAPMASAAPVAPADAVASMASMASTDPATVRIPTLPSPAAPTASEEPSPQAQGHGEPAGAEAAAQAQGDQGSLPRRVPRAHLMPGTLDAPRDGAAPRDPERVRSRLSGFQSSSLPDHDGGPDRA